MTCSIFINTFNPCCFLFFSCLFDGLTGVGKRSGEAVKRFVVDCPTEIGDGLVGVDEEPAAIGKWSARGVAEGEVKRSVAERLTEIGEGLVGEPADVERGSGKKVNGPAEAVEWPAEVGEALGNANEGRAGWLD